MKAISIKLPNNGEYTVYSVAISSPNEPFQDLACVISNLVVDQESPMGIQAVPETIGCSSQTVYKVILLKVTLHNFLNVEKSKTSLLCYSFPGKGR